MIDVFDLGQTECLNCVDVAFPDSRAAHPHEVLRMAIFFGG